MAERPAKAAASLAALLMLGGAASPAAGVSAGQTQRGDPAMTARQEIRERFELGGSPSVTVRGIAGPVTVVSGPGSAVEVDIVRTAASERELQCYRTDVTRTSASLVVEHVQYSSRPGCNSIRSRQSLRLRIPRSANLYLSTIGGRVDVAGVEGLVRMDSIAGRVTAAGVRAADLSSIAGGLSLTLAPLGSRGVSLSSIVGGVELNFPRSANADVRISSVQGNVASDWPGRSGSERQSYRLGSGGPNVSISSVIGEVRIRRF